MVTLIEEQEIPAATSTAPPAPPERPLLPTRAQIITVLVALAQAVGHRIALILAIAGAITLAMFNSQQPSLYGVLMLTVFGCFVVIPVVTLSGRKPA